MRDFEFFLFYINFIIFLYYFDVLILKINFLKYIYIYIYIYFQLKKHFAILIGYHHLKYIIRIDWRNNS
jgi:hypothetical protein